MYKNAQFYRNLMKVWTEGMHAIHELEQSLTDCLKNDMRTFLSWCFICVLLVQNYLAPGDGMVADLQKPLLANTWSAAFSFAKCHLEESVPYDPFTPYIMGAEQFPRFVRYAR